MTSDQQGTNFEAAAFYLAVGLLLIPIWAFPVFATQDGPVHLYNADLIRQLLANKDAWFSDWIRLNPRPDPTWAPHLLLAGLLSFLPVDLTEKLFQTVCIAALPVAARYALGGLAAGAGQWAWLSLPMAYSFSFHLGFYSFCLGLSFSMLMLGYWIRHPQAWGPRIVITQACLALAAYFSHVFAMLAFGIAMLPLGLVRLWQAWRTEGAASVFKGRMLTWVIAFAPALLLAAEFMLARPQESYPIEFGWRFKALAQFSAIQSYRDIEAFPSLAASISLFGLSIAAAVGALRARNIPALAWIGSMGLLFAMAVFLPESRMLSDDGMKGGAYFVPRIGLVFYLCSLFLIAAQLGRPRFQRAVIVLGIALAVAGMAVRWPVYLEINEQLQEYRSAGQFFGAGDVVIALNVERGSFLRERRNVTAYANPMLHEVERLATSGGAFSFNNYQGHMGYFPTLYSVHANPAKNLGSVEAEPPEVDIPGFEKALGRRVDVLLVWMAKSQRVDAAPLLMQIEDAGFQRVHVSRPQGRMWVYRRLPVRP